MKEIITKDKIATYLRDFFMTMRIANKKRFISSDSFYSTYRTYLIDSKRDNEASIKDYQKMINFVIFFTIIREFSILYDNFFPYIREEDLRDLDFDSIFVNPSNKELFKYRKRDIITNIRNALNHNSDNLCSFTRDDNGNYSVRINLQGTNPPFNVEMDYVKILEIIYQISARARRSDITLMRRDSSGKIPSYDYNYIDQIKTFYITRVHAKTKNGLTPEQIEKIKEIHNYSKNPCRELTEKMGDEVDIYDSHLSWEQVYAIHGKADALNNLAKQLGEYTRELINDDMLKSIIYNTIPLGILKVDSLEYYLKVLLKLSNSNITLLDAAVLVRNESLNTGKLYGAANNSWSYYVIDNISNEFFAASLYLGYMFDSVIADEEVSIEGKKYRRDKIRNSFVHMRNYFSDKKFYLYDLTDTLNEKKARKIINELNQKFVGSFSLSELINCVDTYYSDLEKKISLSDQGKGTI